MYSTGLITESSVQISGYVLHKKNPLKQARLTFIFSEKNMFGEGKQFCGTSRQSRMYFFVVYFFPLESCKINRQYESLASQMQRFSQINMTKKERKSLNFLCDDTVFRRARSSIHLSK